MTTPLFDWADGHARKNDPQTSHIAAKKVYPTLNFRCAQFLDGLTMLGTGTANEVAAMVTDDVIGHQSVRRRASDLIRLKRIVECGVRECTVSKRLATVYALSNEQNEGTGDPLPE